MEFRDAQLSIIADRRKNPRDDVITTLCQAEIDGELATARAERSAQAAELPAALSQRYEALRSRLKGTGAARLIGHRCDGCHLELSPVEVDRIRAATPDTVVTCDQCGRILVPI